MPQRIEANEFYCRVETAEKKLVDDVVNLVLKAVADYPDWHGVIALVGGRLNKKGKRKDTDVVVIAADYSYKHELTLAIEDAVLYNDKELIYQRLTDYFNGKIALYLQSRNNRAITPVHLILPSHKIGSNNLDSPWPWHKKRRFAILAEF
ncbi:hypothetical protein HYZ70_01980 [Candidatus Curtissbacteria bacterium]|nr:hypothetical protein [Candidatus Curtissbacteria bacterium]